MQKDKTWVHFYLMARTKIWFTSRLNSVVANYAYDNTIYLINDDIQNVLKTLEAETFMMLSR